MKEPTHNIKLYSGNNIPCPDSTWYENAPHWYQNSARGWLGSGITDRNDKEIFEGDTVLLDNRLGVVRFANAQFYIDRDGDEDVPFTLNRLCSPFIEVVGHVAEEQP